jgi:hypothetical protein
MTGEPGSDPDIDPRLLRAVGDVHRQAIVAALGGEPANARTLAERLEMPLTDVRRRLAELAANDAIEPVDGDEVEPDLRRYRAMIRPMLDDAHWEALPAVKRQQLFEHTLGEISRHVDEALASGGFGHVQTHVSYSRPLLDDEGWQQLTDLLAGVIEEVMQIEAECADRRVHGGPELEPTHLAILHFGRPDTKVPRAQPPAQVERDAEPDARG